MAKKLIGYRTNISLTGRMHAMYDKFAHITMRARYKKLGRIGLYQTGKDYFKVSLLNIEEDYTLLDVILHRKGIEITLGYTKELSDCLEVTNLFNLMEKEFYKEYEKYILQH